MKKQMKERVELASTAESESEHDSEDTTDECLPAPRPWWHRCRPGPRFWVWMRDLRDLVLAVCLLLWLISKHKWLGWHWEFPFA